MSFKLILKVMPRGPYSVVSCPDPESTLSTRVVMTQGRLGSDSGSGHETTLTLGARDITFTMGLNDIVVKISSARN